VIRTFQLAAQRGVPVFTHVRSFGRPEPGSSIEAVSEVIGAAAISGASLQIVHINSSCVKDAPVCLEMISGARARGLDVTTEAYPYLAGMTYINSALFNPGWREKLGVDYDALVLPDSGEHLTKERFDTLHASTNPQAVLLYVNTDQLVDSVIANPLVSIASDGEMGHPRNAGTYSRILARYVRELGSVTLIDAIRKMSLMPAQRLEKATASAHRKGRLQEGADADVVVFDAKTVADRATYKSPREPSTGMRFVLVGGTLLIDKGKLVANTYPGKPLCSPECAPAY
jgi:N-acyl-D-aspartate/D-glutamate deacylase